MKKLFSFMLLPLLILVIASCQKGNNTTTIADNYTNAVVLQWNEAATIAVARTGTMPPMAESRIYAMVNVSMHDALNNIVKRYNTYALSAAIQEGAHPDAAVAQAAHDVLIALLPPQQAYADSLLTVTLTPILAGAAKEQGIALGKAAAVSMLAKRNNDGGATAQYPVVQGVLPGEYQSTFPFAPGFTSLPGWGKVKPFSLTTAAQFRPAGPYALTSAQYTADFNEIKKLGCLVCPERTPDQTQIGYFWLENVPYSWNRIARILIAQKGLNGWETARLLALLQIAEADANIGVLEAKFFYNYWRPLTAIQLAATDGNPDTQASAAWDVLAPPTPPVPDYPSNHATDGGAAAELIKRFFGKDDFTFSTISKTALNITRSFTSLSQAATEVSLSRIYVGYHFRNAVVVGEALGRKIGQQVFENSLLPVQ
jgi:hypothetical protein